MCLDLASRFGIDLGCPFCEGLIWINLKHGALPMWSIVPETGLDRPCVCPWCFCIFTLDKDLNPNIIKHTRLPIQKIKEDQLVVLSKKDLNTVIFDVLKDMFTKKKDAVSEFYKLDDTFNSINDFSIFCKRIIDRVALSHKKVRRLVNDV